MCDWVCIIVLFPVYFAQSVLQVNYIHISLIQVLHTSTRRHEHKRQK